MKTKQYFNILLIYSVFHLMYTIPELGYGAMSLRIVDDGKPAALIILPSNSSDKLLSSARILQEYVEKSSGAKLPINVENIDKAYQGGDFTRIWLGKSSYAIQKGVSFDTLDSDGFIILPLSSNNIIIAGPTDWGTEFGVYEFLERFGGIRWLLPGADGEHVPAKHTWDISLQQVKQEPAFFSRRYSGFRSPEQNIWTRRNRLRRRVNTSHNLFKLFPPEIYQEKRPDFFPIIRGKRYFPPNDEPWNWQPCFSAAGIVEEAIKNIKHFFSENPEETSYSLSVNDSGFYCKCDVCVKKLDREKNFLGRDNYSDIYYDWANEVVKGVLESYPDKWFGSYAFSEVAEPPKNHSIHPRIIPFMTYDRMKWIDPEIEKQGKELTKLWSKKAKALGWYDYVYGTPYMVPRVYFHKMAEYLLSGLRQGVRAITGEAYPNWGEGPKLYIALKLLWNPYSDVDRLLQEWTVNAVGVDAAPDLMEYYEHWEHFWTKRILKSPWFARKGQYLRFMYPEYLDLVTFDDIEKSRWLLESVVLKAKTQKQKTRARILLKAFEYYEASVVSYLGLVKKKRLPGKSREYYVAMNKKRLNLVREFKNDPTLIHPLRFDHKKFRRLRW